MENLSQFIKPELLVTIPILYYIGMQLRKIPSFSNAKIPFTLGLVSVALCILYTFSTVPLQNTSEILQALFTGITQGLLCAGTTVYTNQLYVQSKYSQDSKAEST